ncbi:hypothetical protein [Saccharothrix obliqua]|uniref:hypothetical protein n=1 Tax=Saccharothrix obliqua TaxID=2861747 RepID=UPI001C5F52E3|nr:hypothetical protein [Saccharothrix obliqua]MBW4718715.1 hypothetical protein [Saccharothrix obliqua]
MSDLDLPPRKALPHGVRDAALVRLRAGLDEHRPRHLPLKVGAAIVALAVVTTAVVRVADRDAAPAGENRTGTPELRLPDAADRYAVRPGEAPEGAAGRCHAGSADLPPPERWRPIATASRFRVDLVAFETPAGVVFCETTPATVTVSEPRSDPGTLTAAFRTTTGSWAGFTGPDPRPFALRDRGAGTQALAARFGPVFLVPAGFTADAVVARPEVTDSAEVVQEVELSPPAPAGTATDREVVPQDRTSPEGRRLGLCLGSGGQPVPDHAAWRAGQFVRLSETESVQLGHYADMLLLCRQDRTTAVYDLNRLDAPEWAGTALSTATLRGVRMYYDFVENTEVSVPYRSSTTFAVIAEVTDARVASVSAFIPGTTNVTTVPVAGSVVLAALKPGDTGVVLTVRDSTGAVLEEVRREF